MYTYSVLNTLVCSFCFWSEDVLFGEFLSSATKDTEKFIKNVTNFDSKMIPPCWRSLKQKMLRTIFVNSIWTNATDPCCVKLNPEDCGWILIENTLKPIWFIGDPTPMTVEDILSEPNNNFEDIEVTDDNNSSDENFFSHEINSTSEDEEEDDDDNNNDENEESEEEDQEGDEENENLSM